jgi:hypothetical protein
MKAVILAGGLGTETSVCPKIALKRPITGMEPEYQPLEMEGT